MGEQLALALGKMTTEERAEVEQALRAVKSEDRKKIQAERYGVHEYKGHQVLGLPLDNGQAFQFGYAKARAILTNIEVIKDFVKSAPAPTK